MVVLAGSPVTASLVPRLLALPGLGHLSTFQHRQLGCPCQEMAHRALMSGTAVGTATDRGPQLVSHVEQDREVAPRTLSWVLCGQ